MLPICSPPTLLDGLEVGPEVKILQIYDPNNLARTNFKSINNSIVVLLFMEYHNPNWIDKILAKSVEQNNYYIIVHSHDYPDWIKRAHSNRFTLINDHTLYNYYVDKIENISHQPSVKKLHFLSLNNRASVSRQSLYYFFEKFSLRDKSYFSYLGDVSRTMFKSLDDISNSVGNPWYSNNLNLAEINKLIPVTIPGDTFNNNDWSRGQEKYYNDTFCSIVMETYVAEQFPYFSEKVFKPIAFYHPFILQGNKESLKYLQDMGFKTFGNYWDESYDALQDNKRLEAIFYLILEIANWSHEKINLMYNSMLPILEYNHNHFFNTLPKMFEDRKPKLFEEIKNIAQSKQGLLV